MRNRLLKLTGHAILPDSAFFRLRWRSRPGDVRAPLTEAEYRAALPGRMQAAADELNERCAPLLPDGVRFAYETGDSGRDPGQ